MTIRKKHKKVPQAGRTGGSQSHTDTLSVCLEDSGGGTPTLSNFKNPKKTSIYIATYNVKTLLGDDKLIQLENELSDINWDIVGLAEVRRRGENLIKLLSDHTFYYIGQESVSQAGVGFIIHRRWAPNVICFKGISERVALLTLKINRTTIMKIIQVYAPTSNYDDEIVEQFYEEITEALEYIPTRFTILMGDFNAKLGFAQHNETKMGNFGYGTRNNRGLTLYNFLEQRNLFAMNSFFKKKAKRKWTWLSPDGQTKNEIDYIITNNKNIISDVSVLNKVTTGSDHRMVRTKIVINEKLERMRWIKNRRMRIDNNLLKENKEEYQIEINKTLQNNMLSNDIEDLNRNITSTILNASSKIAKQETTKKDLISKEAKKEMEKRRELASEGKQHTQEYRTLNKKIRDMIRAERQKKMDELITDTIENNNNMRVLRPCIGRPKVFVLNNERNEEVRNRQQVLKTIESFYTNLYNTRIRASPETQESLKRTILNVNSEEIPSIEEYEVELALKTSKNNKSPGNDGLLIEMLKEGGEGVIKAITSLLNKCLIEGTIPNEWKRAKTVLIHKKGSKTNLENYRPITLLSQLYKILTKIIKARLSNKFEQYQPREQAGFRKGYGTCDHLLTLKILLEKSTEYNLPIYMAFVDYEKAFDSIELWAIKNSLQNCRIDSRYINLIMNMYKDSSMFVNIIDETDLIPIRRGVRQGDTISPNLFTLALEDVFKRLSWHNKGININGQNLHNLRYADDIVIFSENAEQLQEMLEELQRASAEIGLKINKTKTKIMTNTDEQLTIILENTTLEQVEQFIYLGQLIKPNKENQDAEINRRIKLGWVAFGKLSYILKNKNIPLHLRAKVYDQCVLPVITYGAQTWTLTKGIVDRLAKAQRCMERQMLHIKIKDRKPNAWIREKTQVTDVIRRVTTLKWKFAGHNARHKDERWNTIIQQWRPWLGKRGRGRPKSRWADDIKRHAGLGWIRKAQNRGRWRAQGEAYVQKWINLEG